MTRARLLRVISAAIAGIAIGSLVGASLPPLSYTKDIQQEYLAARALRDGGDIFAPIPELSARYFPAATHTLPNPSPHPPWLALLSVPVTFLPFPVIPPLWLALNLALLIAIGRWLRLSLPTTLLLTAWPPLWCLLYIGQYELVILALAMLGWRAAAGGRDWRAGVWMGLAAAMKFYPAFFILPFLTRRRLVLAAGGVFALTQVGNVVAAGLSGVARYYGEVLPAVSAQYMHTALNTSPYGAFLRLFSRTTDVAPLAYMPGIVLPLTAAACVLAVIALLTLEPEAAPLAVLVGLPAVWSTYVVLALPQMAVLVRCGQRKIAAITACAAASLVLPLLSLLLLQYIRWTGSTAPPVAALLALQPAGVVGLLVLSMLRHRVRNLDAPSRAPAGSASGQVSLFK